MQDMKEQVACCRPRKKNEYKRPQVEAGLAYCGKSKVKTGWSQGMRERQWMAGVRGYGPENKFELHSVYFRKPVDGSEQVSDIL